LPLSRLLFGKIEKVFERFATGNPLSTNLLSFILIKPSHKPEDFGETNRLCGLVSNRITMA
jgi:hypothetical protein